MLVNDLIHGLYPEAIVVGEDVSHLRFCLVSDTEVSLIPLFGSRN